MPHPLDPAFTGAELLRSLSGGPPPEDLVDRIGGWDAVEVLAPTLVDEPLLTAAVSLLARDAARAAATGANLAQIRPAALALTDAVLGSSDPLQFTQNINTICTETALAGMVGAKVAATCLTLAAPPRTDGDDPPLAAVIRHAVALEALARLAVQGHASKNKLLGVLEDVAEPQPRRYAQAVVRTVGLAFDHWTADDEVADVIDILTGEKPPTYTTPPAADVLARNDEYHRDIAADAMWTKANVEIARALRSTQATQMLERLTAALEALELVTALDDRDDAKMLRSALRLLQELLQSLEGSAAPQDAATWKAAVADAEQAVRQAHEFAIGAYGLNHWSGDRKLAILEGWSKLANDLAWLRDQLSRDSLYDAAVVLDDVLTIYSASRSYDVTRNAHGVETVLQILRPAVANGFAARAGLLRHLSDHTERLRRRVTEALGVGNDASELQARLMTSEAVLENARARLLHTGEPPGKPLQQAADIPPLLAELFGPHASLAAVLTSGNPVELAALAADIADRQAASDRDPDVTVTGIRKRMLAELAACEDFTGDVATAVSVVLDQLIKFVARRLNTQQSTKAYLFKPDANEQDLHTDLYDWLSQGQLASSTNVEVHEVGAGRTDIQISFPGFHLYLELKADGTAVPVAGKAAYIKQTVSYQASDVRIGFLVVLRLKAPKDKSPSMHLTELVSHTVVQVQDGLVERHVVMLEVPGNQTSPSGVH
ncbi:hypothetical protein OOJ91_32465 [Micromonospora lupini]|uniref:hypothetical protein n=1 Tax=Micromonospora lupini TaxID=285679 RepID=UPI00225BE381|nr:hypothetical protein [Micromonospora lupini]MCX5070560.1 hypothetical protein [Micromonospora lupini]